ncbi:MAG TPA: DUF4012 domain-containing protein [Actinomycetales bacterium]|nr:DUF4012 domain-containing protein [Actinomycetales bacterium]
MTWDDERPGGSGVPGGDGDRPAALTTRRAGRVRRRRRRSFRWVVLALVGVVVVLTAWLGARGWLAKRHLENAAVLVPRLEQQAEKGQPDRAALASLQDETESARRLTSDPVWRVASHLPWVGDDLSAVGAAARAVDTVADDAVPPLVRVAGTLDPTALRPKGGRFDLKPLTQAQAPLRQADAALTRAQAMISPYLAGGRDAGTLLGPVDRAVTKLGRQIQDVADKTATGSRAADLLPGMLGADGKRSYLVVFQNLAEARSLGGIGGAFAVVEADHGRLRIAHQGTAGSFPRFDRPVVQLSPAQQRLYQPQTTRFFQNVTQPISFPVGATIAREMWRRDGGAKVDGVLATDPVALSYVLRASGPVTLPGGVRLTSDNAVRLLLRDVYDRYEQPAQQDAFFASAAVAVFQRLVGGAGDPAAMLDALAQASGERRLLVWSAHEDEEKRLRGTVLDGTLPSSETSHATLGVFFNDATASKMSYYLHAKAQLTGGACRSDGMRDAQLVLRMTSTAPPRGLPRYVTGTVKPYTVSTVVYLAGAREGGLVSVHVDGKARPVNAQEVDGRLVAALTVDLRPGQTAEIKVAYLIRDEPGQPRLRMSPMVNPSSSSVTVSPCRSL